MRAALLATLAVVAFAGCTVVESEPATTSRPVEVENINLTEADFRADFAAQTSTDQDLTCDWWWSMSESEYDDFMWDEGYSWEQINNAWNALVKVCP
jgi:hypothetical protein